MAISLTDLFLPLKKWWWLLILAAVLAGGVSYMASLRQPLQYRARAILMVGRGIDNPNPTSGQLYLQQQLAIMYANLANREPVRQAAMDALNVEWIPHFDVVPLQNTQMLEVVVVDTNPRRAQAVVKAVADVLVARKTSGGTTADQERTVFIQERLDTLQSQIEATQQEIDDLQDQLGTLDSARDIQDTRDQITALEAKLNTLQANFSNLYASTQQGDDNQLSILEEPAVPTDPIGPNNMVTAGLAAMVGLALAAAGVYLMHFLDKAVKTPEEVTRLIPALIIGSITKIPNDDSVANYVSRQPRSPISDSFRSLRANLEFVKSGKSVKTILVTGAMSDDGKSTIASNLARIIAQTDQKVILLDGDLRNSALQTSGEWANKPGLSDLLIGKAEIENVLIPLADAQNISLIPPGAFPPNPTELLESQQMGLLLDQLREKADVVIIDGPPFIVSDAAILSSQADGLILVVQVGQTHKDAIKAMMEQIELTQAPVLGIVLNRAESKPGYYSAYYHHSHKKAPKIPSR